MKVRHALAKVSTRSRQPKANVCSYQAKSYVVNRLVELAAGSSVCLVVGITLWFFCILTLGCTLNPSSQKMPWRISVTHYAQQALEMGDVRLAISTLTPYVQQLENRQNPDYRAACQTLGLAHYQDLNYAKAARNFQQAEVASTEDGIKTIFSDFESSVSYAIACSELGDYRRAVTVMRQILLHQPINPISLVTISGDQPKDPVDGLVQTLKQDYIKLTWRYHQQVKAAIVNKSARARSTDPNKDMTETTNWQSSVAVLPIVELDLKPPRFPTKVFQYLIADLLRGRQAEDEKLVIPIAVLDQILNQNLADTLYSFPFDIQRGVDLAGQFGFSTIIVTELRDGSSVLQSLPKNDQYLLSLTILDLQQGQVYESPILEGTEQDLAEKLAALRAEMQSVGQVSSDNGPIQNAEELFYLAWATCYFETQLYGIVQPSLGVQSSIVRIGQYVSQLSSVPPSIVLPLVMAQEIKGIGLDSILIGSNQIQNTQMEISDAMEKSGDIQTALTRRYNQRTIAAALSNEMINRLNQHFEQPYVRGNGNQHFPGTDIPVSIGLVAR